MLLVPQRLYASLLSGREERIRTSDPSVPNAVLYQTEPLPEQLDVIRFFLCFPALLFCFFVSPVGSQDWQLPIV